MVLYNSGKYSESQKGEIYNITLFNVRIIKISRDL